MSDWKPGQGQTIDKLYAWIAVEPDGGEGVCAYDLLNQGFPLPLVGADRARVESLRPFAEVVKEKTGYRVRLKVFGAGVAIDEIKS